MLKLGRENVEQTMSEVLKPVVTPLQKLVTASQPERNLIKDEIKDEVKQDVEADDTFRSADESFKSLKNDSFEEEEREEGKHDDEDEGDNDDADVSVGRNDPTQRYLDMLLSRENKQLDTAYGVRKLAKNELMIGDSPISFESDRIHVGDRTYLKNAGLIELLFRKVPDESSITQDDMDNYKNIILTTNSHRKYYKPDGEIRKSKSFKFNNVIAKLIEQSSVTGKGIVPRYMIAAKDERTDYVYWDDPNESVDRLRLLLASREAGNPSHSNEIVSIIEELREAGIIY
ncbi:uncharacterized protein LOC107273704 [Cephus cinctus]|uniref:Uncharacterized protein LOC107273704 n=1 Tax=Cephus cinctus TaxID=211228 RepID=A0AAJ7CCT3_CEPCN|nr:uncharacterized protein LOC107273704 [Cephus cinctus]